MCLSISSENNSINIEELNEKWRTVASPLVFIESTVDHLADRLEVEKEKYRFGETVSKLKSFQSQGKKLCLFMGRTPYEKLPSDNNEAMPNEIWASADIALISPEYRESIKDLPGTGERYHFWMDLNHQPSLMIVCGLFDKIVIDISMTKFLTHDYPRRFSVLLHTDESVLIFDNSFTSQLNTQIQNLEFNHNFCKLEVPQKEYIEKFKELGCEGMSSHFLNLAQERGLIYLKEIYHKVDEYSTVTSPFPYKVNRVNTDPYKYVVMSNLKK